MVISPNHIDLVRMAAGAIGGGVVFLAIAIMIHYGKVLAHRGSGLMMWHIFIIALAHIAFVAYVSIDITQRVGLPYFTWRLPLGCFAIALSVLGLLLILSHVQRLETSDK